MRVHSHDREIGVRIAADADRLRRAPVRQRDDGGRRIAENMAVGEDESVRGEDDARPDAVTPPGLDLDDGGTGRVDGGDDRTGISVEQGGVGEDVRLRAHVIQPTLGHGRAPHPIR